MITTNHTTRTRWLRSVLLAATCVGCQSPFAPGSENMTDLESEPVASTTQALTGNNKFCSVFQSGHFRDSIIVPDDWTSQDCSRWAWSLNVPNWQLGCIWAPTSTSDPGFALSAVNAYTISDPHCWFASEW